MSGVEAVAYCDPSNPFNHDAFAWPGADRKTQHTDALYSQATVDTLRAQLKAAEAEVERWTEQSELHKHMVITCGVAATHPDPGLTLTLEGIDAAFDAAAADLEANKAEYEPEHINGAYYGLCLMRMEIRKDRTKEETK